MKRLPRATTRLFSVIIPLILAVTASGCALFGLGAAAGAAVGGCALLDENDDATVTEAEASAGLFDEWDDNGDEMLSESEFEGGIEGNGVLAEWSGSFDAWDVDDDDTLSEQEFAAGVAQDDTVAWADEQCDDLGL